MGLFEIIFGIVVLITMLVLGIMLVGAMANGFNDIAINTFNNTSGTPYDPIMGMTGALLNSFFVILPVIMVIALIKFGVDIFRPHDSPTVFVDGMLAPRGGRSPPPQSEHVGVCESCGHRGDVFQCHTRGENKMLCEDCLYA